MDTYTPNNYKHPAKIDIRGLPGAIRLKVPAAFTPDAFKAAKKTLDACFDIDLAKNAMDWTEGAAAWARMADDKELENKAKRFRILCWRKVGEILLANKAPAVIKLRGHAGTAVNPEGRRAQAAKHGISPQQLSAALSIARVPQEKMDFFLDASPMVPSPTVFVKRTTSVREQLPQGGHRRTDACRKISASWSGFLSFARRNNASSALVGTSDAEKISLREQATELSEWLDELIQRLPKSKGARK